MKRKKRIRRPGPRLPIDAVFRTGSVPQSSKKGKRGYDRKEMKKLIRRLIKEQL